MFHFVDEPLNQRRWLGEGRNARWRHNGSAPNHNHVAQQKKIAEVKTWKTKKTRSSRVRATAQQYPELEKLKGNIFHGNQVANVKQLEYMLVELQNDWMLTCLRIVVQVNAQNSQHLPTISTYSPTVLLMMNEISLMIVMCLLQEPVRVNRIPTDGDTDANIIITLEGQYGLCEVLSTGLDTTFSFGANILHLIRERSCCWRVPTMWCCH
ncbi:hypothetical protein MPTK1_6g15730 [Marchantia polymorpha subsp. ruderalis]|uniref:Uncharacterized protein n=2 Tax=Marchantia polymorpha TaxID=3197 RepID=A0AAF6BSG6_MARPO|nr:hypothetical protein MARPO_0056s0085 [Marchantia polymorpha]BBN14950.1 hypothetical protein Mp_6g15730 [Marchantia polymorpha subsp. ruderalis]|eukprot:PTQ37634.1 hypothetical protein MARPO_0056s0085 [Marchantia polymorpha]